MSNKFAKLLEVEAGQVLITIEASEELPEASELHIRLYLEGVTITHKLPFPTRERALSEMEMVDSQRATALYDSVQNLFKPVTEAFFLEGLNWQEDEDGASASFQSGEYHYALIEKLANGTHLYTISNGSSDEEAYKEYISTQSYAQFELALREIDAMSYEEYCMTF